MHFPTAPGNGLRMFCFLNEYGRISASGSCQKLSIAANRILSEKLIFSMCPDPENEDLELQIEVSEPKTKTMFKPMLGLPSFSHPPPLKWIFFRGEGGAA